MRVIHPKESVPTKLLDTLLRQLLLYNSWVSDICIYDDGQQRRLLEKNQKRKHRRRIRRLLPRDGYRIASTTTPRLQPMRRGLMGANQIVDERSNWVRRL